MKVSNIWHKTIGDKSVNEWILSMDKYIDNPTPHSENEFIQIIKNYVLELLDEEETAYYICHLYWDYFNHPYKLLCIIKESPGYNFNIFLRNQYSAEIFECIWMKKDGPPIEYVYLFDEIDWFFENIDIEPVKKEFEFICAVTKFSKLQITINEWKNKYYF
ncbi:Hypothetical protein SRAE_X000071700 [Strongyloides ratti]|uniref:Uncharacterized protein n=1 Tax=Strongyloides ratti TaxID=34506 RepID=A0A090LNE5_STRRB|nr:Hypothetical protein SRAE_X000071700 [Strongyloides ratti]CEF71390.1 Hypothetical protein SRAE_X000071700 [Strongyloides ratti]